MNNVDIRQRYADRPVECPGCERPVARADTNTFACYACHRRWSL